MDGGDLATWIWPQRGSIHTTLLNLLSAAETNKPCDLLWFLYVAETPGRGLRWDVGLFTPP